MEGGREGGKVRWGGGLNRRQGQRRREADRDSEKAKRCVFKSAGARFRKERPLRSSEGRPRPNPFHSNCQTQQLSQQSTEAARDLCG